MCYKHVLLFLINTITDFPVTKYSLTAWKKYRASISAGNKKQLPPLLAIQNCWKNQFGLMVHILWHAHRHMHPGTVVQQRCRDFFLECLVWWNFFSCSFKTFNYLFHMRTQTFDASLYLFYRQIWPAWSFKKCKSISAFFSPCKLNVSRF